MSGFFFSGGSSQPGNPDYTAERDSFTSAGAGTGVTSGSANTKGSATTIGTAAVDWCGFYLYVGAASSTTVRFLADIKVNGTTKIPNLFLHPSNNALSRIKIPLKVPASQNVDIAIQGSSTTLTLPFAIRGIPASASLAPGFDNCAAIHGSADTANTLATSSNITMQTTVTTWTELDSAADQTFGAILMAVGRGSSDPTTAQDFSAILATGASSSEVEFDRFLVHANGSTAAIPRAHELFERSIASGTRVSCALLAGTAGATDYARVQAFGFY